MNIAILKIRKAIIFQSVSTKAASSKGSDSPLHQLCTCACRLSQRGGIAWKYLDIFGNIWIYLEIFGQIGHIWKYTEMIALAAQ